MTDEVRPRETCAETRMSFRRPSRRHCSKDGKERAQLLDVHLGLLATKSLRRLNRSIKPVRQQREISV
jgi:hypothetical protein